MASMMSVRAFAEGLAEGLNEGLVASSLASDELIGVLHEAAEIARMDWYAITGYRRTML